MDEPFYPPAPVPPPRPLGPVRAMRAVLRNPIELWHEGMYRSDLTALPLLGRRFVTVTSPALAQEVLLDRAGSFRKSPLVQRMLVPGMGEGLLTAEGADWAAQRRAAAPLFRPAAVRELGPGLSRIAAQAAEALAAGLPARGDAAVTVDQALQRVTLDIVVATLFGDETATGIDRAAVARDVVRYLHTHGNVELADYLSLGEGWPRRRHLGRGAVRRLRAAAAAVARRGGGGGLIGRLTATEGLSEAQVVDNVVTFIGAGHETTALGVAWALSILAHRPALQEALGAEVAATCPDRPATVDDTLPLHGRVLDETMRLYPPAPAVGRAPREALELGGVPLTPDDHVTVSIWVIGRHHAHWPDPGRFDPDRFRDDAPPRHRFAYMPFGGGPRICIGAALARGEMRVLLAEIMRRVRVAPESGHVPRPQLSITLRPKGGLKVRARRA